MYTFILVHVSLDESASESESEVWEDSSSDISDVPDEFDLANCTNPLPTRGQLLAQWILRFLMVMQASFKIPDTVVDHFLRFFAAVFTILSKSSEIVRDVCLNFHIQGQENCW